jgi:hypothetical protein
LEDASWLGWRAFHDVFREVGRTDFQQLADDHLSEKIQLSSSDAGDLHLLQRTANLGKKSMDLSNLIRVLSGNDMMTRVS